MYAMVRVLVVSVAASAALGGCSGDGDKAAPEAQQLARMNRELAALRQTVDALGARMDRAEARLGPEGAAPESSAPGAPVSVVLGLDAHKGETSYAVEGQPVSEAGLVDAIRAHEARARSAGVVINAPSGVAHARVMDIIDRLRAAGIERFSLSTQEPDAP